MPRPGKQPIHRRAFQSAPAIAGGRCTAAAWALVRLRRFNPRPPLLAGDAPAACSFDQPLSTFQSAPAIAGGRCDGCPGSPTRDHCFNPRPPLLAGDAGAWPRRPAAPAESFNPRPPLLAGDAQRLRCRPCAAEVSIRARHCWRAMRAVFAGHGVILLFQSAPAIAGGRCPGPRGRACQPASFNPRPPLLAGDAPHCQCIANPWLCARDARTWIGPADEPAEFTASQEKTMNSQHLAKRANLQEK